MDFPTYLSEHASAMDRSAARRMEWLRGVGPMDSLKIELDEDIALAYQAGRVDATSAMLVHLVRRFPAQPVSTTRSEPGVDINAPSESDDLAGETEGGG